jgi:hypothetical protein
VRTIASPPPPAATPPPPAATPPRARVTRAAPARKQAKPAAKERTREKPRAAPPQVVRPPHDTIRIGLPVGRLLPGPDGSGDEALLIAAALLLAGAAAGSLVVGTAARKMARQV